MSFKTEPVNYNDKTDARPVVDRERQSTAEDWNEVKRVTDALSSFLHVEASDIALVDGNTSHEIPFDNNFSGTNYRVLGNAIVVYKNNGDGSITEVGIKNITKYVDRVTFETYKEASNYRVDYYLQMRS